MANQYINKVIYGGKTLIDMSGDTVSADKLLKGLTAHDKSGAVITGTCTFDVDSGDADVAVAEILEGKIAYARGAKVTGTMPNKGAVTGAIAAVADAFTIPLGYHDGSGSVAIKAEEQAKLIAKNIREGVTILGVMGTMSGSEGMKPQAKTVTPSTCMPAYLRLSGRNGPGLPWKWWDLVTSCATSPCSSPAVSSSGHPLPELLPETRL